MTAVSTLEQARQLASAGEVERAREVLRAATAARLQLAGEHREWALLAEELGLVGVAEREFNLALRDDPDDRVALEHLVELALERGNLERAVNLLTRRVDLDPQDLANTQRLIDLLVDMGAEPRAHQVAQRARSLGLAVHVAVGDEATVAGQEDDEALTGPPPSLVASDADCARFLATFGGREDVYARQWFNPKTGQGGYAPVREPLTPRVLRQHFAGDVTLGVYPIRLDGTCLFCAIDLDLQRSVLADAQRHREVAQRVRQELAEATDVLRQMCATLGITPLVEDSGYKGRHFWIPLSEPLHAGRLVALGRALLSRLQPQVPPSFSLEWFPKASRPGSKGLGNLIKLPLGIHRRTGRRSSLLDDGGQPVARPFELLRTPPRLDEGGVTAALTALGGQTAQPPAADLVEASPSAAASTPHPPPVVDAAGRPFSAADFDRHPAFRQLFARCAVLAALRDKAIHQRHLTHDELVVLAHCLGHMPSGVAAFNYLLGLCPGAPAGALLKSPLRGNPISCPKIRARISHITATVPCNCIFPETSEIYPHPLLHLRGLSAEELAPLPPVPPPDAQVRRLLILRHRIRELQAEAQALADELIAQVRASAALRWELPEGVLALEEKDGIPELVWIPAAGENHGPPDCDH